MKQNENKMKKWNKMEKMKKKKMKNENFFMKIIPPHAI